MPKKEVPRKDVFSVPLDKDEAIWSQIVGSMASPEAMQAIEEQRVEHKGKSRKREWEKMNPAKTYRGVPKDIRKGVVEIATNLNVRADDVARVFFEYGLKCIQRGTLRLDSVQPKGLRMTLYPFSGAGWAENTWSPQPPKSQKAVKGNQEERDWKEVVSYRIPTGLHERVKELAGEVIPLGEVVTILLKNGIEGYEDGQLVLLPQQKIMPNLDWKG